MQISITSNNNFEAIVICRDNGYIVRKEMYYNSESITDLVKDLLNGGYSANEIQIRASNVSEFTQKTIDYTIRVYLQD